jgi:hypothetical protein
MKKLFKKVPFYSPLLLIPLLFSVISYFLFRNIYLCLVYFLISTFYIIFLNKRLQKINKENKSQLQMCELINTFIINLSVRKTLKAALEDSLLVIDDEIKQELIVLEQLTTIEAFQYIAPHFPFSLYQPFLIEAYEKEGGDILDMSALLLSNVERERKKAMNHKYFTFKMLAQFASTWSFVFLIMIVLRLSLQDLYLLMLKSPLFTIGLNIVFFVAMIGIEMFITLYIKGDKDDEKKTFFQKKKS